MIFRSLGTREGSTANAVYRRGSFSARPGSWGSGAKSPAAHAGAANDDAILDAWHPDTAFSATGGIPAACCRGRGACQGSNTSRRRCASKFKSISLGFIVGCVSRRWTTTSTAKLGSAPHFGGTGQAACQRSVIGMDSDVECSARVFLNWATTEVRRP
jgi:hypothetical protein